MAHLIFATPGPGVLNHLHLLCNLFAHAGIKVIADLINGLLRELFGGLGLGIELNLLDNHRMVVRGREVSGLT